MSQSDPVTDTAEQIETGKRLSPSIRFIEQFLEHSTSARLKGLLLGKLDAFNRISTTFGHERSEQFCADYARRLRAVLPTNTPVIRLSERRFAVLLALDSMSSIMDFAAQIAEETPPQMRVGDDVFHVDVTLGISVFPTHADGAASLFRRAELALEEARDRELTFDIYRPDQTQQQAALWKFQSEIEQAVAQGELEVYYQPKISLQDSRVSGVEALVRWRHPSGRLVGPNEFIPLAERSGAIVPMTWLVFERAAEFAESLAGLPGPFGIAINVAPQALTHGAFFDRLESLHSLLEARGLELTLELTEDSLLESDTDLVARLARIKQIGASLSIDDFGKGYSSLTYLKDLPADELKIDKRFVGTLAVDDKDRHIVQAVISLAHAFGMRVVAEGVDNRESLEVIAGLGCEAAQGFYFARPMRGDLLLDWIRTYAAGTASRLVAGPVPAVS